MLIVVLLTVSEMLYLKRQWTVNFDSIQVYLW